MNFKYCFGSVLSAALIGSMSVAHAAGINVLVIVDEGGDSGLYASLAGELENNGQVGSVTVVDENSGPLPDLASYQAVLAYTDDAPSNPSGLGDALQAYVQGGGGVVLGTYAFSNPWAITGGIMTPGYSPLVNSGVNGDVSGNLVQAAPSAIFNGIDLSSLTYFSNGNYAQPTLDPGATLLATDGAGVDMIAINAAGDVISDNLYPGQAFSSQGEYDLIANELAFVSGAQQTQPVPEPASMAILGAGIAGLGFTRRRKRA